jgi:ActR/RegA family two-component response regulator
MEDSALDQKPSVLVIDRSEETREVLQTALNLRGVRTFTAKHTAEGIELNYQYKPKVIIYDLDTENDYPEGVIPSFGAGCNDKNVHLILLGTFPGCRPLIPGSEFMSKPYHYGPLIRRIEQLVRAA